MLSILAQERLLGFALGGAFTGFVVFEQRRRIHDSISAYQSPSDAQKQLKEPILGKQFRSESALLWNKAVDQAFGLLVSALSSHRE
ncbi:unnamed protein product [Linum tenue]|uniref:Uncharacterized protein n=1 Tax=Linum tenue TaxID=586396 RepID=A0AAV0IJN3_9ROSI|nr:unnamed protein product [Linum tenue]